MSDDEGRVRHSKAEAPTVVLSEQERAEREAANALVQAARLIEMIEYWATERDRPFKLRPSTVLELNRLAIDGLDAFAGNWRPGSVVISMWQPMTCVTGRELAKSAMRSRLAANAGKSGAYRRPRYTVSPVTRNPVHGS